MDIISTRPVFGLLASVHGGLWKNSTIFYVKVNSDPAYHAQLDSTVDTRHVSVHGASRWLWIVWVFFLRNAALSVSFLQDVEAQVTGTPGV